MNTTGRKNHVVVQAI